MNLFKRGHNYLTKKLEQSGKEQVEYIKGNVRTPLMAEFAMTIYHVADGYGVLTRMEVRDFIVRVQDLPNLPARGEFIVYGLERYEIIPLHGEDVFKYSDEFKTNIRIHTKIA